MAILAAEVEGPLPGGRGPSSARAGVSKKGNWRGSGFGYILLTPQMLGFVLFALYPLAQVVRLSFYHINALSGAQEFVGLDNFVKVFTDSDTPIILLNTVYFVAILSVSGTVFALLLALLVNQRLPGINIFRAAIFVPALVTMVAWTIVWKFILQPGGLLDAIVSGIGTSPEPWLRSHWLTLTILAGIQLLKNVGLNMMLFLAALQAVPAELIEASKVDGASSWRTFRHIVLAEISPAVLMVFILMIVSSFKVFDVVYILTEGGPGVSTTVLSYAVYSAFKINDIGLSSALGVLLFIIVLVLTIVVWQLRKRFVSYEAD